MTTVRIDIAVTGWQVEVRLPAGAPILHPLRAIPGPDGAEYPAPDTGGLAGQAVFDTVDALRRGLPSAPDVRALGDHLFDALLARAWPAIVAQLPGATLLELALHLEGAPTLAGLPWELMRQDGHFLAAGVTAARVSVAVTRRVSRGTTADLLIEPLTQPLRYLFVVGNELDRSVRAGAECLGLLRQLGGAIQERIVLLRASKQNLGQIIDEFSPQVVHFICHGKTKGGQTFLELFDHGTTQVKDVDASTIADTLVRVRANKLWAPPIVVLGACDSGTNLAARLDASFAGELVTRGIPAVVAMSAEISDLACRLFTRGFGESLTSGTPMLHSAARARRAALRSAELSSDSFEWGLVNVVLEAKLRADDLVAGSGAVDVVKRWLVDSALEIDHDPRVRTRPAFCGRTHVFENFYDLLAGRTPLGALCLHASPKTGLRLGKRRTLTELAALAIKAGHVPVVLMPRDQDIEGFPSSAEAILGALDDALLTVRKDRQLPTVATAVRALPLEQFRTKKLGAALGADLALLAKDAGDHPFVGARRGKAILVLNDLHKFGDGVVPLLEAIEPIRNAGGLMLFTWAGGSGGDDHLKAALEKGRIQLAELLPFSEGEEALVYQRVLLNPLTDVAVARDPVARRRLFLDLRGDENYLALVLESLRVGCDGGYPGSLTAQQFYLRLSLMVPKLAKNKIVSPYVVLNDATDDTVLENAGEP